MMMNNDRQTLAELKRNFIAGAAVIATVTIGAMIVMGMQ
jgi:hypothetical protein